MTVREDPVHGGPEEVLLALGSNLEPREEHLLAGLRGLASAMTVTSASSIVETPPLGVQGQGPFLNMVVRGTTDLEPADLLAHMLEVERRLGRVRTVPGGPRTLDLDLLFYGARILRDEGLTIPHPRWAERRFVVEPLLEIAPDFRDPVTGRSISEAARPGAFTGWLRRWAPPPSLPARGERVGGPGSGGTDSEGRSRRVPR